MTGALLLNFTIGLLDLADGWDDPTAWQYYLSNVPLLVGWGLLFVGAALAAREWRTHTLLGRVALWWTPLGFGVVTAGFLGVVFAQPLGGMPVSNLGNMLAGMGMIVGVAPGSILLGIAALREGTTARRSAALLSVGGVAMLSALLARSVVPELLVMALFLLLPVAWLVYGLRR